MLNEHDAPERIAKLLCDAMNCLAAAQSDLDWNEEARVTFKKLLIGLTDEFGWLTDAIAGGLVLEGITWSTHASMLILRLRTECDTWITGPVPASLHLALKETVAALSDK